MTGIDDVLRTACSLQEAGFAVHWLRPKTKYPVKSGWSEAPAATRASLEKTYMTGCNVGFRPGQFSVVDGMEICVLDIDVRGGERYAEEAHAAANSIMEGNYEPTVISGSLVGRHQYIPFQIGESPAKAATVLRESDVWVLDGQIVAPDTPQARPAWQIELLSTGKQVVLPPSIHPDTHQAYSWAGGQNPWA